MVRENTKFEPGGSTDLWMEKLELEYVYESPLKAYFATFFAGRGDKRTGMDRNKAQTKVYICIFLGTSTADSNMAADVTNAEQRGTNQDGYFC